MTNPNPLITAWRYPHLPYLALASVGLLMVVGLWADANQWRESLRSQASVTTEETPVRQPANLDGIARLFPPPAKQSATTPSRTQLPIRLLGSFVSADPSRSSAMIQLEGKPARRLGIGEKLIEGVRLEAIGSNHVLLSRGGKLEELYFSHAKPSLTSSATQSARFQPRQLLGLSMPASQETQRKVQTLLGEAGVDAR